MSMSDQANPAAVGLSRRLATWGPLMVLATITAVALAAPIVAPHNPAIRVGRALQAPSLQFLLGTDEVGRDLFSRVLIGVSLTWLPSLAIIAAGVVVGSIVGLVCGTLGGKLDFVLQRLIEVIQVIPSSIIALATIAVLGPGVGHTILAVSLFWWPWYARLVRSEVRVAAAQPHVEAARLAGVRGPRLMLRYLLPAAVPVVLVTATLDIANAVLVLALLSFLGLGAPAPAPELGAMTARTLENLVDAWWLPLMPAAVIFVMVLAANLAGDTLRSRFAFT